ncbi:unnamed protein product, partial [Mesorhabditis spiculigera]
MSDASSQEASEESTDESSVSRYFIVGRIFNSHRTRDMFNSLPLMRDSNVKLLVRQLVVRGRSANNVVEYSFIERLLRGHDDDWLRRKCSLDAATLISIAGVNNELRDRVEQAPKRWESAEAVHAGYVIDYDYCASDDARMLLHNAVVADLDEGYIANMPDRRGLQHLPNELLRIIADQLDIRDFRVAANALPRFRRVSVWAKQQPDGSEKTVIHIDGQRYNDDLTAFLINRATTVYTIMLDRTITELPAFVTRFPKCHEFDFYLDEDVEDPTWPGLVDFLKRQRMANLTINSPCLRAEPLWADVLRSGGWTNKRLAGWKSATIHNVTADDLRLLTRFNGTTLRIIWCPHNPPDENLALWDYINNMADRRLKIGQGITVHFNQGAMPNMSSPTILFAGKTLSAEGRGYSLRYVLRDGILPYTIIAQYDTLRLRSVEPRTDGQPHPNPRTYSL